MSLRLIFTLLLFVLPLLLSAINEKEEVKKKLSQSSDIHEVAEIQYQLSRLFITDDIDSALHYAQLSLRNATDLNDRPLQAKAYYLLGYLYDLDDNVERTIDFYTSSMLAYRLLDNRIREDELMQNLISIAQESGVFEMGEHYSEERIKIIDKIDDYRRNASVYFDFGVIYAQDDQLVNANESFLAAKKIYDANLEPADTTFYARILTELGIINRRLGHQVSWANGDGESFYEQSAYYFTQSMRIDRSLVNRAKTANNQGNLWLSMGKIALAKSGFLKAKALMEEVGSERLLTVVNNNLGKVYYREGLIDSAYHYFNKAVELNVKEKSLTTDLKDLSLAIDFYLVDELEMSVNYLDSISSQLPQLVSQYDDQTKAFMLAAIEKEKAFIRAKAERVKTVGYGSLKKELEISDVINSLKERKYIIIIALIIFLFLSYNGWLKFRKWKVDRYNQNRIDDYMKRNNLGD